ncbi:MAG TPA: polyketide cyclase / dehydrase and lipid transport [Mycobacteriales bacterium]|nr:polyketide cyclase / dehydrase and lipid transport [Mycobacteriales bacterium]
MAQVDLIEETFVAAAPERVAAAVHEHGFGAELWPDLRLVVFMDRGLEGVRWTAAGALTGSCEVWLEPYADGVIVHTYLRCDPSGGPLRPREAVREVQRRARHAKQVLWALKDRLEAGRTVGGPAAADG